MEERKGISSPWGGFTDYYNIVRDVAREWATILMVTISSCLIAYMLRAGMYKPV